MSWHPCLGISNSLGPSCIKDKYCYPMDKLLSQVIEKNNCAIHPVKIYPVDNIIQALNKRGLISSYYRKWDTRQLNESLNFDFTFETSVGKVSHITNFH